MPDAVNSIDQIFEAVLDPLGPAGRQGRETIARWGNNEEQPPKPRHVRGRLVERKRPRSHTSLKPPPQQPRSNERAFALAAMSVSPYDVRPRMLRLFLEGDLREWPAVRDYFLAYLANWCCRTSNPASQRAQFAAVHFAINARWRMVDHGTEETRAKRAHMRKERYRSLEAIAERAVFDRWIEALEMFVYCLVGTGGEANLVKCNGGGRGSALPNRCHAKRRGRRRPGGHSLAA